MGKENYYIGRTIDIFLGSSLFICFTLGMVALPLAVGILSVFCMIETIIRVIVWPWYYLLIGEFITIKPMIFFNLIK